MKNSQNKEFETVDLTNLTDFQKWKNVNGSKFGLMDYYYHTNPEQVMALTSLFCPEFVEHKGLIFFKDRFTLDNFNNWRKKLKDGQKIQSVINHVHLTDEFLNLEIVGFQNMGFLAKTLTYLWKLQLEDKYPSLKFTVKMQVEESDFVIYFFQNS